MPFVSQSRVRRARYYALVRLQMRRDRHQPHYCWVPADTLNRRCPQCGKTEIELAARSGGVR